MEQRERALDRQRRDVLEDRIRATLHDVPDAGELELLCDIVQQFRDPSFPYAATAEWQYVTGRDDLGRGDLVFADRTGVLYTTDHPPCSVLILEVKYEVVDRDRRNNIGERNRQHRRDGAAQVQRSMRAWSQRHPYDNLWGAYYSNTTGRYFSAARMNDPDTTLELVMDLDQPQQTANVVVEATDDRRDPTQSTDGWGWLALGAVALGAAAVGTGIYAANRDRRNDRQ